MRTTRAALSVAASSSSFSRPLRGLATKDLVLRLAQEVSRASPAGSAAAGANGFCPSLRAIKTSLFGKSGKRFQNLLNGCRREASFLYDMHHKFVDKLYDFAKNWLTFDQNNLICKIWLTFGRHVVNIWSKFHEIWWRGKIRQFQKISNQELPKIASIKIG